MRVVARKVSGAGLRAVNAPADFEAVSIQSAGAGSFYIFGLCDESVEHKNIMYYISGIEVESPYVSLDGYIGSCREGNHYFLLFAVNEVSEKKHDQKRGTVKTSVSSSSNNK